MIKFKLKKTIDKSKKYDVLINDRKTNMIVCYDSKKRFYELYVKGFDEYGDSDEQYLFGGCTQQELKDFMEYKKIQ